MRASLLLPLFAHKIYVAAAPAPVPSVIVRFVSILLPISSDEWLTFDTSYVELEVTTYPGFTNTAGHLTIPGNAITKTVPVDPRTTSPTGISTTTLIDPYNDNTVVQILLESGSGDKLTTTRFSSLAYTNYNTRSTSSYSYPTGPSTNYVMNMTYTPYPECSQRWTYTTAVNVYLYSEDMKTLAAVATETYTTTVPQYGWGYTALPVSSTGVQVFLNPTALPTASLNAISSQGRPYRMSDCYRPTTTCSTTIVTRPGAAATLPPTITREKICTPTSISPLSDYFDRQNRRLDRRIIGLICALAALVALLIFGIIWDSYKAFRDMMCGKERRRGVPLRWCFCITCVVPCAGPRWKERSTEEQVALTEKWNARGAGEKFKLWLQWGYKWKYPVDLLGQEPDRLNKSWRKQHEAAQVVQPEGVQPEAPQSEVVQVNMAGKQTV